MEIKLFTLFENIKIVELPLMTKTSFDRIDLITLIVISELICNTFVMENVFGHVAFSNEKHLVWFQTYTKKIFTQLFRVF